MPCSSIMPCGIHFHAKSDLEIFNIGACFSIHLRAGSQAPAWEPNYLEALAAMGGYHLVLKRRATPELPACVPKREIENERSD